VKPLKELIEKIRTIPPLSQSAMRLMELMNNPNRSLQQVAEIVQNDPSLTANVLKVVNAPAFGLGRPVTSLSRALSFLGERMIVGIALGSSAPGVYGKPLAGYESEAGELWEHSLRTAIASREMAGRALADIPADSAFTAGILHDIGKSLLSEFIEGKTREIISSIAEEEDLGFLEAERRLLGFDHCQAGLALAEHWNLPEILRQAISHHHEPANAPDEHRPLVFCVHLGDMIAMLGGTGVGADCLAYPLEERFQEYVSLTEDQVEEIALSVAMEFEKTRTLFFD